MSHEFIQTHFSVDNVIRVGITIFIFLFLMYLAKRLTRNYFGKKISTQSQVIFIKIINSVGFVTMIIIIINQFGFTSIYTTALGSAGVVGIAFGFASKTSLENIISGVLLLSDKSFKIGDMIVVGNIEGTVQAIDSLSVKIITYDNKLVRVPNIKLLNSDVINLYPENQRRCDFYFKVSYKTDVAKILQLLKEIAQENPYAIRKDETYVYFRSFKDLGYEIKYGVWFEKGNITVLSNTITEGISVAFAREKIEIPTVSLSSDNL